MFDPAQEIKLVVVGDGGTGKTSFVARLCREGFHQKYVATLGYEITKVVVDTTAGPLQVELWDTAGQEKTGPLRDAYYEGAHGVILFFDVTSRVTYKNIPEWHRDVTRVRGDDVPTVLFANKVDVPERKLKTKSIKYHEENQGKRMILVEASVKNRINLDKPFEYLLRHATGDENLKITSVLETSLLKAFGNI